MTHDMIDFYIPTTSIDDQSPETAALWLGWHALQLLLSPKGQTDLKWTDRTINLLGFRRNSWDPIEFFILHSGILT